MNFQALTQAARNVFREWFKSVRSHKRLLVESHTTLALALVNRKMTFLFAIPILGTFLNFFLSLDQIIRSFPPRGGDLSVLLGASTSILMFAVSISYIATWTILVENAHELQRQALASYRQR